MVCDFLNFPQSSGVINESEPFEATCRYDVLVHFAVEWIKMKFSLCVRFSSAAKKAKNCGVNLSSKSIARAL